MGALVIVTCWCDLESRNRSAWNACTRHLVFAGLVAGHCYDMEVCRFIPISVVIPVRVQSNQSSEDEAFPCDVCHRTMQKEVVSPECLFCSLFVYPDRRTTWIWMSLLAELSSTPLSLFSSEIWPGVHYNFCWNNQHQCSSVTDLSK